MEKKTIGSFIAALRKANGMTQKNLAEMLNVSDKTVSRWERDESAPDLSLIPVIAEIFGITSDELLRGERKPQNDVPEKTDGKKEKQLRHIAESTKTKFLTRSVISAGIGFAGLLAAMIANFGFLRAITGFFISCVFIAAAVVCEAVFLIHAFSSVKSIDFEENAVNECKKFFVQKAYITFSVIAGIFSFSLPLVFGAYGNAYVGIEWYDWFLLSLLFVFITAVISLITKIFVVRACVKKEVYKLSEEEARRNEKQSKLTVHSFIALACVLLITFIAQFTVNELLPDSLFMDGIVFENYDDFKEFMETEAPNDSYAQMSGIYQTQYIADNYDDVTYYDENGNVISWEQALTEYVYDKNGNLLCEYLYRNESVATIEYNEKSDDLLPITVYTDEEFRGKRSFINQANTFFMFIYSAELALAAAIYIFKRKNIK